MNFFSELVCTVVHWLGHWSRAWEMIRLTPVPAETWLL